MAVSPIATVQSFVNRNPAVNNLRQDGSIQARLAAQQAIPTAQAPVINARQNAFQNEASKINSWGRNMTAIKQQGVMKKRLAEIQAEQARAAAQVRTAPKTGAGMGGEVRAPQRQQQGQGLSGNIPAASGTGVRAQLVRNAASLIGTPYAWGGGGYGNRSSRGTGKGTQNVIGVDCSGLTSYVYGLIGMKIPRHSNAQTASGYKTSIANAQPGDLIGWGPGGHVAIYAGNGEIIEAPKPGTPVRRRKLGAYDSGRGVYAVRLKLPGE